MIERLKQILREWLGESFVLPIENTVVENTSIETPSVEEKVKKTGLLQSLEDYLFSVYNFRFNLLTEQTEYALKESADFRPVDQRMLNTLCMEARKQGVNCWDKDVSRLLLSQSIGDYHPFRHYMETLPAWDGIDRVSQLSQRVSDKPLWVKGFHRWMLGMVAQWMGLDGQCANAMAPLLISTEQGRCKSTFCSILLPTELQRFYIDKFDLTSVSGCEQKLSLFGLINMDEFDRYSVRSMATLKNLMQLKKLTFRKSHRAYYSQLPRIASFIGTSNQKELLTDTTGSRRFLCVEVKEKIDCSTPDYPQLYAQLKAELLAGDRYWFTSEEEQEIQENNRMYYKHSPEQDVFFRCFRLPSGEEEGLKLSSTEIFCQLQKKFPAAFRGRSVNYMGRMLQAMGVKRERTREGSMYRVVPVV
ncbi:MAG: helicase [Bacteroides sp.]|nr:helicase [Bacteroides sp.]